MKRISFVAFALLGGCVMQSTYEQIKKRPPAIEFHTDKSADEYLGCISPRFAEIWPTTNTTRDGSNWVVTVPLSQIIATVTIAPANEGAQISYRQMNDMTRFNFGKGRAAVESCQ